MAKVGDRIIVNSLGSAIHQKKGTVEYVSEVKDGGYGVLIDGHERPVWVAEHEVWLLDKESK